MLGKSSATLGKFLAVLKSNSSKVNNNYSCQHQDFQDFRIIRMVWLVG